MFCRKNLKRTKRWEGWNVAIATMCTASSSGSLRRTLAQFARLLSPRLEIPTPGTFCRTGWNRKKNMLFCTAHYICYCYINTTSIRCILQIEMPYFGYLSSNLWVLNSETLLLEGNFEEVLQRRMNHVIWECVYDMPSLRVLILVLVLILSWPRTDEPKNNSTAVEITFAA